jgi:hypothetical protein
MVEFSTAIKSRLWNYLHTKQDIKILFGILKEPALMMRGSETNIDVYNAAFLDLINAAVEMVYQDFNIRLEVMPLDFKWKPFDVAAASEEDMVTLILIFSGRDYE